MYKMLLVDDDYITREGLRDLIEWSELEIEIVGDAEDGVEALEKARVLRPDIVLSDVVMPAMDGIKLLEVLKRELPEAKVIMISAHQDIYYMKASMKLEALDYILKPFNIDELKEVIIKVVNKLDKENEQKRFLHDVKKQFSESIPIVSSSEIVELQEKIISLFGSGNIEALHNTVNSFFDTIRSKNMSSMLFLTAICTELLAKSVRNIPCQIRDQISNDTINSLCQLGFNKDSHSLEKVVWDKLLCTENLIQESKGTKLRKVIRDVEGIIQKRYKENITIKQLADEVYMSPSHLQCIFKKETGSTINDYITTVRIEKAKELLKKPELKIYDVSNLVGYLDTNYFAKIFKKLVGKNPAEYRESLL
jgi:two-component system, response regulator YesN